MLGDQRHVLVLGMIFEVGVELIGPGRVEHVHKPGHLVVDERDGLRGPVIKQAGLFFARAGHEFLQDQQVPLLVVLLGPGLRYPVVDAAGQPGARRDMGDGNVGDLLPALVGNPRDQLEDLELGQSPLAPVDAVEQPEKHLGGQPVRSSRGIKRLLLGQG
jgi:hypothetical protein